MQKKFSLFIAAILAVYVLTAGAAWAQQQEPQQQKQRQNSPDDVWREIDAAALKSRPEAEAAQSFAAPAFYKAFRLNKSALDAVLERAPREFSGAARMTKTILTLPLPDGGFARFRVESSPVMDPALAAKYPEIQSYRGQGIDDPAATARFDLSPNGFRAAILSRAGATIYVEPYAKGDASSDYISFYKRDADRSGADAWTCEVGGDIMGPQPEAFNLLPEAPAVISGSILRTYRLALAATGEYTNRFRQAGDTDAQAKVRALAAMNTTINRVNQVYERDVAIRLILIPNTDLLIYTDPNSDPYTNNNGSTMLGQNQTNIDSVIGPANYDIGHVFSTGGGGIAGLAVPCGATKARGVTGMSNPVGDFFAIDYVAHEIGHQFGAQHTFNSTVEGCGGNRSGTSAFEPGSGVTIMGYAGLCGSQDLANRVLDTFHVRSIEAIVAFSATGNGNSCAVQTPTGNTPPDVSIPAGASFNIPKQTPFALTAAASDANGDALTYDWQQYNAGGSSGAATVVPNSDADGTPRPLFRVFGPVSNGSRTFPALTHVLNTANVPPNTTFGYMTGELLPAITRVMNFQVIVRDNRAGGGGVNTTTVAVNVDGNSGPFAITAPNTSVSWQGGTTQTVTWNVANTAAAPVNAANVKISLSTDGGQTYPTTILESTPNDGSENIVVPSLNAATTQARLKIEAVGNIFFDVADVSFTVTPGTVVVPTTRVPFDFDGDRKSDIAIFRPSEGVWYLQRSRDGFAAGQFGLAGDKPVAADFDGDGMTDVAVFRNGVWYWLKSSNGTFDGVQFGLPGDKAMVGDYDGDGKADPTIFRPSDGVWYLLRSRDGFTAGQFGMADDRPVAGDFDGDGKSDVAIYRPSEGVWYLSRSRDGFAAFQFGLPNDVPAPADYDGDGKTDITVFRPSEGVWYLSRSRDGFAAFQFGLANDIPTPGDYDGDGAADISVFRPVGGVWYQQRSQTGFTGAQFGLAGDVPIEAPLH